MWRKQNLKSENRKKKTDFQTRKSEKKSGFNMLEFEKALKNKCGKKWKPIEGINKFQNLKKIRFQNRKSWNMWQKENIRKKEIKTNKRKQSDVLWLSLFQVLRFMFCYVFAFKFKHKSFFRGFVHQRLLIWFLQVFRFKTWLVWHFKFLNLIFSDFHIFHIFQSLFDFVWKAQSFSVIQICSCAMIFSCFFCLCVFLSLRFCLNPLAFSKLCLKRYIWFIWLCDVCFRISFMFSANFHCS